MSDWQVERLRGGADGLHHRDALADATRRVSVLEVEAPAMVLGSTQRDDVVEWEVARAREVAVVRRRTGGGAVFLDPGQHVWIDVTIPPDDQLWRADVAHAFDWLGKTWIAALADVGVTEAIVNETAVCHSVLGRLICFAGLGFGEASTSDGKVVGISQRRARTGVWFQCVVVRSWDTSPYRSLLAPGLARAADDSDGELDAVRVRPVSAEAEAIVTAFVRHLPA